VASLQPFPLPGGEAAVRRPNRAAFGLLWAALGEDALLGDDSLRTRLNLSRREAVLLAAMIRRRVNTPWTSSVGRLFDAVAALALGIHEVSYEGEAAAWLEAVVARDVEDSYPLPPLPAAEEAGSGEAVGRGDWRPLVARLRDDLARDADPAGIAARLHNALARWAADVAATQPVADVVLTGGCFQNRCLAERVREEIAGRGRRVHLHGLVPPNDGGLAAGQLAIALACLDPEMPGWPSASQPEPPGRVV
jgi:hydrogenase maturation protein HypF